MKNEINSFNPYLSDLFSIGMIALRILGHPVNLCYTIGKNLDLGRVISMTQQIKNPNLRSMVTKLTHIDPQIRGNVFNEVKMIKSNGNTAQTSVNKDVVKTRTLGKVSSVRKSFGNNDKSAVRYTKPIPLAQGGVHYPADQNGLQFKRTNKIHDYSQPHSNSRTFTPITAHPQSILSP